MSDVGRRLTGFLAENDGVWVDESEGVDDHFAFDGLNGVNDYGDGAGVELFEGLSVAIRNERSRRSEDKVRTCCVLISTLESQHPNPGWEWYHPTTISGLCSS